MSNGLGEVTLAQPRACQHEKRVIGLIRPQGEGSGGREGKLIARPHNKAVKGEFFIEPTPSRPSLGGHVGKGQLFRTVAIFRERSLFGRSLDL